MGQVLETIKSQEEMVKLFKSRNPKPCQKKPIAIEFRVALEEEEVITELDGEKETTNTAKSGDYIIKGISQEHRYVLTPEKFEKNYEVIGVGIAQVKPQPRFCVEYKDYSQLKFITDWGEMICNSGDFLVSETGNSDVYRVERKEFLETYELL